MQGRYWTHWSGRGPSGIADVSMYTFSFNANDLILGSYDSTYYYIGFPDSSIAKKINSGAAALLYLYSDSIWNPLPYTEPHDPMLTISYFFRNIYLVIEVITNYGDACSELIYFLNGNTYQLRLLVIPANNLYLLKSMHHKPSYNEIKTLFNLQN